MAKSRLEKEYERGRRTKKNEKKSKVEDIEEIEEFEEIDESDDVESAREIKIKRKKAKIEKKVQEMKNQSRRTKYSASDRVKMFFTFCFRLGVLGIICFLIIMYGPWNGFRDWLVTTAMTTMHHQYFATWFYNDDIIATIQENNKVEDREDVTDSSMIDTSKAEDTGKYANEYERQILERDPKNNDYKIIPIKGDGYSGYLTAVYEPQRMKAAVTSKMGVTGEYVTKMAKDHDALIAINGGGFVDNASYSGTGDTPMGISVVDGQVIGPNKQTASTGIIGFDQDNALVIGQLSVQQVRQRNIRDGLTFGPFLIINGEASSIKGDGGWGSAPRTVIGQRADGIVLLMVVDGRRAGQSGASIKDELEVMERYGAINAANLDGGTSSVLVVGETIVNDPIDSAMAHKTRPIASCFYLEKDESDDSDHSLVQAKLNKAQASDSSATTDEASE